MVSPIHRDDLSWHTGAVGEHLVADTLSKLPVGWHVFHSIPVGTTDADVDHVVVGPGGVFTISTKHHSGKKVWITDRRAPKGAHVEGGRTVGRWLRKRRAQLSPEAVARIVNVIDGPRVWRAKSPVDLTALQRRYYELVHLDRQATLIRFGWLVGITAFIAVISLTIAKLH